MLIAFAILAVALMSLVPVFTQGLGTSRAAAKSSAAVLLAESKLAAVGHQIPLTDSTQRGEDDSGMAWALAIQPYGDGEDWHTSPPLRAYQVVVTVQWRDRGRTESVSLRTLRLAPAD